MEGKLTKFPILPVGTFIDKWELGDMIEETDHFQYYSTGEDYVVKLCFKRDKTAFELLENEITVMRSIESPDIIDSFGPKFKHNTVSAYLVKTYYPSLEMQIHDNLDDEVKMKMFLSLFDALKRFHETGHVYVNPSPENLGLDGEGNIVLTNFELARRLVNGEGMPVKASSPSFVSLAVQGGASPTVGTDLESMCYTIMAIDNRGLLPWKIGTNYSIQKAKSKFSPAEYGSEYALFEFDKLFSVAKLGDYDMTQYRIEQLYTEIIEIEELERFANETDAQYLYRRTAFEKLKSFDTKLLEEVFPKQELSDEFFTTISLYLMKKYWYKFTYPEKIEDALNRLFAIL